MFENEIFSRINSQKIFYRQIQIPSRFKDFLKDAVIIFSRGGKRWKKNGV